MTFSTISFIRPFFLLFALTCILACSKKNDPTDGAHQKTTIQGAVEKGPFVRGSVVTIYELNAELNPTGRSFKSEIQDDKGSFSLADVELSSNYVQLSVDGYYFNEINGSLSGSPITLNAIADISNNKSINVNVLSHLEEKRVRSLMKKDKKSFSEAKKQALTEIYAAFFVKTAPNTSSELVSLTKNDDNANILLGISAALLQISSSDNARLTELLSIISADIENDGSVDAALKQSIKEGLERLNAKAISDNMKNRYKGLNITLADFAMDKVFSVELKGTEVVVIVDDFFNTEAQFLAAYNAVLAANIKATETYFKLEGLYCKTISGMPQHDFYRHDVGSGSASINTLFSSLYVTINRANTVMDNAAKSSSFKSFKHKTYPFYAYSYWMLMNFWGDTPFMHTENYRDTNPPARTDKKTISEALLAGLEASIQNLATGDKEADMARSVAARIAADNGDYATAKKYLSQIINASKYTLASKTLIHTTANESIFGIDYNQSSGYITKPSDYDQFYGKGNYRSLTRYTEVLLLASEVNLKLNNKDEAIDLLNLVRVRNGKLPVSLSENNVLPLLQEELKADLSNEGVFFAFLKRNNLSESTLGIQSYQKLMPIPQMEMMLNRNMVQNPGY
uniref:RagB/SusD family nutrient uptake outer membrane protein n=1 Tax=Pedobacter schmidteae TaxID=2201271 RepID=UPI000EAE61D1|nr:RagB/SusD family nutrient uptake outer membrane protein [Pedobacter schmidteae]